MTFGRGLIVHLVGAAMSAAAAQSALGLDYPRSSPAEIVDKLNREINEGLADVKLQARFADLGYVAFASSRTEFEKLIAQETEKWAKVIKFSGAKPD